MDFPLQLRINSQMHGRLRSMLSRERKKRGISKKDYDTVWEDDRGYIRVGYGAIHYMVCHTAGIIPKKGQVIHHINCDKKDNRLENLIVIDERAHNSLHYYMRANNTTFDRAQTIEYCDAYVKEHGPREFKPKEKSTKIPKKKIKPVLVPESSAPSPSKNVKMVPQHLVEGAHWTAFLDWFENKAEYWQKKIIIERLEQQRQKIIENYKGPSWVLPQFRE